MRRSENHQFSDVSTFKCSSIIFRFNDVGVSFDIVKDRKEQRAKMQRARVRKDSKPSPSAIIL